MYACPALRAADDSTEVGPVTVFLPGTHAPPLPFSSSSSLLPLSPFARADRLTSAIDKRGPSADWQYFAFSPHFEAHFVPQEDDPGVVELVTVVSARLPFLPAYMNLRIYEPHYPHI